MTEVFLFAIKKSGARIPISMISKIVVSVLVTIILIAVLYWFVLRKAVQERRWAEKANRLEREAYIAWKEYDCYRFGVPDWDPERLKELRLSYERALEKFKKHSERYIPAKT